MRSKIPMILIIAMISFVILTYLIIPSLGFASFYDLDSNNDRLVRLEEIIGYFENHPNINGPSILPIALDMMQKQDLNEDGVLTVEEFYFGSPGSKGQPPPPAQRPPSSSSSSSVGAPTSSTVAPPAQPSEQPAPDPNEEVVGRFNNADRKPQPAPSLLPSDPSYRPDNIPGMGIQDGIIRHAAEGGVTPPESTANFATEHIGAQQASNHINDALSGGNNNDIPYSNNIPDTNDNNYNRIAGTNSLDINNNPNFVQNTNNNNNNNNLNSNIPLSNEPPNTSDMLVDEHNGQSAPLGYYYRNGVIQPTPVTHFQPGVFTPSSEPESKIRIVLDEKDEKNNKVNYDPYGNTINNTEPPRVVTRPRNRLGPFRPKPPKLSPSHVDDNHSPYEPRDTSLMKPKPETRERDHDIGLPSPKPPHPRTNDNIHANSSTSPNDHFHNISRRNRYLHRRNMVCERKDDNDRVVPRTSTSINRNHDGYDCESWKRPQVQPPNNTVGRPLASTWARLTQNGR